MKKIISTFLAAVMLFTSAGISAKSSTMVVTGTNLATGENIKSVMDESRPFEITFNGDLHETYNNASNVYLNNVQMNESKVSVSVSKNKLTLDFTDGVFIDGTEYTLELSGMFDAAGNHMSKKTFNFIAAGEDKIAEIWKLNKGTYEEPDLLMFDGKVNGTVRAGISVRNLGFVTKTYGVKLVSKKGSETVKTSGITQKSVASGELAEIFAELDVTDREDVYLYVVDGNGDNIEEPIMITTESVPESAMLLDEYWGDSWGEYFTYDVNGEIQSYHTVMQSGWVFDFDGATGSRPTYANNNYFIFRDNDSQGAIKGSKKFLSHQRGTVTLDFEIGAKSVMNGAEVAVTGYNGNSLVDMVKVEVKNGKLCTYSGKLLRELSTFDGNANTWHAFRTEINMDTKTFDMYYNSKLVLDDANFYETADTLSAFRVKTSDELTGDFHLRYLYAHRGYLVYDKFINTGDTTVPEYWNPSGIVAITEVQSSRQNDRESLLLGRSTNANSGSVYRDYGTVKADIQTGFKFKTTGNGYFGVSLKGVNDYYVFGFDIYAKTMYFDGQKIAEELPSDIWHEAKFIFDVDTNTIEFYFNDRKLGSKTFAFADSVIGIQFEGRGGQLLDDVIISKIDKTTTVIDESQIPADDGIDVHMVFYPMWREGSHFGWDRITGYPERTPYLGYYDSGNLESMNMQIKWLVEHGVDAFAIPYSRAVGNNGQKPKFSNRSETLHEGYFNSPYKDMIDFCLLYSGISQSSLNSINDFKKNIVPFWIEHYFKHDNYATTQSGEAVFYMYTQTSFYDVIKEYVTADALGKTRAALITEYKNAGNAQAAAEALADADFKAKAKEITDDIDAAVKDCFDYLEAEVMKITDADGNPRYTGLYTVFVDDPTDPGSFTLADRIGADAVFNYGDPRNAAYKTSQLKRYTGAKNAKEQAAAEADFVPSGYMGYQRHPWDGGTDGGFCEPRELEEVLRTIKADIQTGVVSPEKLITLGCWDEFGEGHFFMPAEVYGFGYLDAVRNVFGDGSDHTDVKPTSLEQRRFGWFYQNDGTGYRSFEWPDNDNGLRETVKGWYFNDYAASDITGSASSGFKIGNSGWTVYSAASCTISDGALKIVDDTDGRAPHMDYGYDDNNSSYTDIMTGDCKKIQVYMESNWENAPSEYGLIYFSTKYTTETLGYKFMQSDNTGSCIVEPFRWNIFRNGIQDTEFVGNKWWDQDSEIKKMRYWPAYYSNNSAVGTEPLTIYLDSVELLGDIAQ